MYMNWTHYSYCFKLFRLCARQQCKEDVRIDVSPQSIWKRKKYIDDEADNNVEVTEDN